MTSRNNDQDSKDKTKVVAAAKKKTEERMSISLNVHFVRTSNVFLRLTSFASFLALPASFFAFPPLLGGIFNQKTVMMGLFPMVQRKCRE